MNKKKNVVTKFQDFWEELEHREQSELWDILTALRGEDGGSTVLKRYTTARIRGVVMRDYVPNGLHYVSIKDIHAHNGMRKIKTIRSLWEEASWHWKRHVSMAIMALVKHCPSKCKDLKKFLLPYDK